MERFKLWLLSLFIKDFSSILRQFEKLTTQLDTFAEKKLEEADHAQQVIAEMTRQQIIAQDAAAKALGIRDKVKENFL